MNNGHGKTGCAIYIVIRKVRSKSAQGTVSWVRQVTGGVVLGVLAYKTPLNLFRAKLCRS